MLLTVLYFLLIFATSRGGVVKQPPGNFTIYGSNLQIARCSMVDMLNANSGTVSFLYLRASHHNDTHVSGVSLRNRLSPQLNDLTYQLHCSVRGELAGSLSFLEIICLRSPVFDLTWEGLLCDIDGRNFPAEVNTYPASSMECHASKLQEQDLQLMSPGKKSQFLEGADLTIGFSAQNLQLSYRTSTSRTEFIMSSTSGLIILHRKDEISFGLRLLVVVANASASLTETNCRFRVGNQVWPIASNTEQSGDKSQSSCQWAAVAIGAFLAGVVVTCLTGAVILVVRSRKKGYNEQRSPPLKYKVHVPLQTCSTDCD